MVAAHHAFARLDPDTAKWEIAAFDFDMTSGDISNRRSIVSFSHDGGHPDGMTIDEEGMLWVAFCGGGKVTRCDPATAERLDEIDLPVTLVTNCVFGGPGLDTLYVSSARVGLTGKQLEAQPLAGALFSARPPVRGIAAVPFGG